MSYDMFVWRVPDGTTREQACGMVTRLLEHEISAAPCERTRAFMAEINQRYTQLSAMPVDGVDDKDRCPWSCDFDDRPGYVHIAMVLSKAHEVAPVVTDLARKHGLACYDFQGDSAVLPWERPETARTPWWKRLFRGPSR